MGGGIVAPPYPPCFKINGYYGLVNSSRVVIVVDYLLFSVILYVVKGVKIK